MSIHKIFVRQKSNSYYARLSMVQEGSRGVWAKNIVICCDGTGNEIESKLSNVLKLFRIITKSAEQRVYYNAGIGTIGSSDTCVQLATER